MSKMVIRTVANDFGAFKVCDAALKSGGQVVSITVSPVMVFDHAQGYQKPEGTGRHQWIVWATFPDDFNVDLYDKAIEEEG
jgi:hypothetical protein